MAFGSKIFSPAQLKMSIYAKNFLAIHMAFFELANILWERTKPTILLTNKKSVTRFLQLKAIPQALWTACHYVSQFNFKIARVAGSVNTAADSLSRLELKVTEKTRLKVREGIQTTPIGARWSHLPRMSMMRNNFSSHKQTKWMNQKNKPWIEKNNLHKMPNNG